MTIVEAADRILPEVDKEISQRLSMYFRKRGISVNAGTRVKSIEHDGDILTVVCENKKGISVKCAKSLTGANGKCLVENAESGYVKLVSSADTGKLLGAQLVCPRATDLVAELAAAIEHGMTAAELAAVIHPHPTFSEMIREAVEALL